jgi:hypothetical protein
MINLLNTIDMEANDYGIVFKYEFKDLHPPPKKVIGRRGTRYCRFCRRYQPEVTFLKEAHIIPQGFGNRYLTSLEQCDECNQNCGLMENDLMNMLNPLRGLAVSRTADKGHIIFKTPAGSFIKSGVGDDKRIITKETDDPDLEFISEKGEFVTIKVLIRNVNFFSAAKALGMMAWHVIPENKLVKLDHFRRWLVGELKMDSRVSVFMQKILRINDVPTSLALFQRRNANKRLAPFVVTFVYEAVALTLPIPDNTFWIEQPQVPLVNKNGNEFMDLQVVSSDKDCRETLKMTVVLGP